MGWKTNWFRTSVSWGLLTILAGVLFGGCKRDQAETLQPKGGTATPLANVVTLAPGVLAAEIKKNLGSLLAYFPQTTPGIVLLPRLGDAPATLESALSRLEAIAKAKSQPNELRALVQSFQQDIGVNPLAIDSFKSNGFDPDGGALATRISVEGRGINVAALKILDKTKILALLDRLAKQKLLADEIKTKKVKDTEIQTAYRKNLFKQPMEEIGWAIHGQHLLVAIDSTRQGVPDPEAPAVYTEWTTKALAQLLAQDPAQSLQSSQVLQDALQSAQERPLFYVFSPIRLPSPSADPKAPADAKGESPPRPKALFSLPAFPSRLGRTQRGNPLLAQAFRTSSAIQWAISTLSYQAGILRLGALLALEDKALTQIQTFLPSSGDLKELHQSLHKDAIFTVKAALKATTLIQSAEDLAKGAGFPLERFYESLQKLTGIEVAKDLPPLIAGHGHLTLYRIAPTIAEIQKNPNPYYLPQYLDVAVTATTTDPAKLQVLLAKLAQTFKLGSLTIQTETKDGRTLYSIPAWPNASAFWTVVGNVFVYSIGRHALERTLLALQNPKERLDLSEFSSVMQNPSAGVFLLNGARLRKTVYDIQLPMAIRLLIGQMVQQLELLDTLVLSASPQAKGLQMQGLLRLTQP